MIMNRKNVLETLAAEYPQLYLNPDTDEQELYRCVVLQGDMPEQARLDHYTGDEYDSMETADTPAGRVRVVRLGCRRDFELVMRGMMAAKDGPQAVIPASQGAAMLTVFNWPRIKAHLALFPEKDQHAEFKRFTSRRENYTDMLIVLSRGPYSNVSAQEMGLPEDEWLILSDTIRRFHELTHVICRRLYPNDIQPVRDELIADAVGLYAAYGHFDTGKEELFLGIRNGHYEGGRLENYTDVQEKQVRQVIAMLDRMKAVIDAREGAEPFALIPSLMEAIPGDF